MAAFEPRSSGEGIDLSANCATTTLRFICQSKTIEINSSAYVAEGIGSLTRREKEVLNFVSKGKSSQDIAELLKLSTQTVKIHRKNILKKLEVNSSIQAIALLESSK